MRIKIQKAPNGKLLGACMMLSAEIMEPFRDLEYIDLHPVIDDDGNLHLRVEPQIPVKFLNPVMEALACK